MARTVLSGNVDLNIVEFDQLSGTGALDVGTILDQDGMANDSANALSTQQSIKAYVDNNAGGVTIEACKAFLSSANINGGIQYSQRNLFPVTGSLTINQGSFTSTAAGIAVPTTGLYMCMFNIPVNGSSTRGAPEFRFSINGTGQTESSVCTYMRNNSGHNDSSAHVLTVYSLTASDVIGLQSRATSTTGSVTNTTSSAVSIIRIS